MGELWGSAWVIVRGGDWGWRNDFLFREKRAYMIASISVHIYIYMYTYMYTYNMISYDIYLAIEPKRATEVNSS